MVSEGIVSVLDELNLPGTCTSMLIAPSLPTITAPLLFVGTANGYLNMYALRNNKLEQQCHIADVGLVSALETGDLFNQGLAILCCISAEGQLSLYSVHQFKEEDDSLRFDLELCFSQQVLSNICNALISDIDHDGRLELVVALTDRIIRTYRYSHSKSSASGKGCDTRDDGRLVALRKWEVPAQILCLASGMSFCKEMQLIVTQPLNRFVRIKPGLQDINSGLSESGQDASVEYVVSGSDVDKQPCIFIPRRLNSIKLFHTLSPAVSIIDHDQMTPLQCPQSIFTVIPLTVGNVQLIATCDWDGLVYIYSMNLKQPHSDAPKLMINLCRKVTAIAAYFDSKLNRIVFVASNTYHDIFMFSTPVKPLNIDGY